MAPIFASMFLSNASHTLVHALQKTLQVDALCVLEIFLQVTMQPDVFDLKATSFFVCEGERGVLCRPDGSFLYDRILRWRGVEMVMEGTYRASARWL